MGDHRKAVRAFFGELASSIAPDRNTRAGIQAEQVAATTQAMRSMGGLIALILVVAPLLTWRHANLPFLFAGLAVVCAASLKGLSLPVAARPDSIVRDTRAHALVSLALGCGWATMTAAMTAHARPEALVVVVLLQATAICIGLLLYASLPGAYPLFATPISGVLAYELIVTGGAAAVLAFLVPPVVAMLGRSCVQQSRRFVNARATDEALHIAREREHRAEREAGEERLRHAEALAEAAERSGRERRAEMLTLANHFQDSVVGLADALAACTANVDGLSTRLDALLANASVWAEGVAARTLAAATTTSEVDAAARSLTGAISEIVGRVEDHARSSGRAHRLVGSSGEWIATIDEEIARVTGVAAVIEAITTQTRLLALNAEIEAARAGAAGRGFAVVASEVKALAGRAGSASRDVSQGIGGVSTRMEKIIAGIRDTATEIDRVAEIATSIAGAIVRQREAAERISEDIVLLSEDATLVRDQVVDFVARAQDAQGLTSEVRSTVGALSAQAEQLRASSGVFLSQLRAA